MADFANLHLMSPVVRRLAADRPLAPSEIELIGQAGASPRAVLEGRPVRANTDGPVFIVRGWAAQESALRDGRRQILRLHLPGDLVSPDKDFPSVALTRATVVEAEPILAAALRGQAPAVAEAVTLDAARKQRHLFRYILRHGRMTAVEKAADLFLELNERLSACGLSDGRRFEMPLVQETLGEVLGLSIVHTNRVLQHLRHEGLIELRRGVVTLLELDELERVAHGGGGRREARVGEEPRAFANPAE